MTTWLFHSSWCKKLFSIIHPIHLVPPHFNALLAKNVTINCCIFYIGYNNCLQFTLPDNNCFAHIYIVKATLQLIFIVFMSEISLMKLKTCPNYLRMNSSELHFFLIIFHWCINVTNKSKNWIIWIIFWYNFYLKDCILSLWNMLCI